MARFATALVLSAPVFAALTSCTVSEKPNIDKAAEAREVRVYSGRLPQTKAFKVFSEQTESWLATAKGISLVERLTRR